MIVKQLSKEMERSEEMKICIEILSNILVTLMRTDVVCKDYYPMVIPLNLAWNFQVKNMHYQNVCSDYFQDCVKIKIVST